MKHELQWLAGPLFSLARFRFNLSLITIIVIHEWNEDSIRDFNSLHLHANYLVPFERTHANCVSGTLEPATIQNQIANEYQIPGYLHGVWIG